MSVRIIQGDCLEVMPTLEAGSFDSIVTDPPYGLSFMGKHWDRGVPGVAFWEQAIRVLKPGSYLLAFGGTRTFHRLTCAIEDAGFEIQDCLSWLYGSGFPKHKSKLKPAWEPIIMARKPASKATHLNIDACRIGLDDTRQKKRGGRNDFPHEDDSWKPREIVGGSECGRWPDNVILDEEAAGMLDAQAGPLTSGQPAGIKAGGKLNCYGTFAGGIPVTGYGDTGGASRFFYCAKASRSERNAGLGGRAERPLNWSAGTQNPGAFQSDNTHRAAANHHPTVKPLALMQWLVRLVTPENGTVLDPFMGSGTTGMAAVAEARNFVGIEREAEFAEIARARIHSTQSPLFGGAA